jgi:hypothetical protein
VHGCDAAIDHPSRVAKQPIKIRNEKGIVGSHREWRFLG